MNFDFLKVPSTIAALLLVLIYFLPMTPYYKSVQEEGEDDNKTTITQTITGLGMLTGSAKQTGEGKNYEEPTGDAIKEMNEKFFGPKPENEKNNKHWKAQFGIFDKLSILIVLAAGLMVFVAYQKSANQSPVLDEEKMGWAKIILIGLGLMMFSRYCFFIGSEDQVGAGLGAWISLLAVIFLALEDRIMKLIGK